LTENAKEDWRRYLELDKSSDWAAEANERTDPAAKVRLSLRGRPRATVC
jgi:hypothetical protein